VGGCAEGEEKEREGDLPGREEGKDRWGEVGLEVRREGKRRGDREEGDGGSRKGLVGELGEVSGGAGAEGGPTRQDCCRVAASRRLRLEKKVTPVKAGRRATHRRVEDAPRNRCAGLIGRQGLDNVLGSLERPGRPDGELRA
jgi:hypothetical protein